MYLNLFLSVLQQTSRYRQAISQNAIRLPADADRIQRMPLNGNLSLSILPSNIMSLRIILMLTIYHPKHQQPPSLRPTVHDPHQGQTPQKYRYEMLYQPTLCTVPVEWVKEG